VIYRVLVGLGKGLSSSKKRSFSAAAVWFATELSRDERPLKEELAEAVISPLGLYLDAFRKSRMTRNARKS